MKLSFNFRSSKIFKDAHGKSLMPILNDIVSKHGTKAQSLAKSVESGQLNDTEAATEVSTYLMSLFNGSFSDDELATVVYAMAKAANKDITEDDIFDMNISLSIYGKIVNTYMNVNQPSKEVLEGNKDKTPKDKTPKEGK